MNANVTIKRKETTVHSKIARKRYTLAELMLGVTPESIEALNAETAWALEGKVIGKELI